MEGEKFGRGRGGEKFFELIGSEELAVDDFILVAPVLIKEVDGVAWLEFIEEVKDGVVLFEMER